MDNENNKESKVNKESRENKESKVDKENKENRENRENRANKASEDHTYNTYNAARGRVRIRDIADELGLSTATVSNVIHGKTKKISDETVKRVQELLEKRQYIPSMAGILLAQNNSRIIGIMINNCEKYEGHVLEDAFIASSLNHLSNEIERTGHFMMVKVTTQIEDIVKFASMWNLEGMVVIGFCEQDYKKLRESMHVPFVIYDGYLENAETGRICNLTVDHYDGGRQAGAYLKQMGHEKVLCIADNCICMDWERYLGFCDGFKDEGGEMPDFWQVPMQKIERQIFYQEHLEQLKAYTAVFAASDYYAIDLMQFLQERRIGVPEDLSIIGFDDNPICQQVVPSLTSIKQDGAERAALAIEKLRQLKEGEEGSIIKLPVTLVKRNSVRKNEKKYAECIN